MKLLKAIWTVLYTAMFCVASMFIFGAALMKQVWYWVKEK